MGRPRKPPDKRRIAELRIRLTEEERRLLDDAVAEKTSTWARNVLLREALNGKVLGESDASDGL